MLPTDNAAGIDTSDMTQVISAALPPKLESLEVGLQQQLPSSKVDHVDISHKLHSPCLDQNSFDVATPLHGTNSPSSDSDTDGDTENAADIPDAQLSNAQRKQAQNAMFKEYIREKDNSKLQDRLQEVESSMLVNDGNPASTASARRIIDQVRDYQSELFARAKAGNIIAVLDTGSGKTLVAALLIRETVCREMDDRASGHSPRTCFFLVGNTTGFYTYWELTPNCIVDKQCCSCRTAVPNAMRESGWHPSFGAWQDTGHVEATRMDRLVQRPHRRRLYSCHII